MFYVGARHTLRRIPGHFSSLPGQCCSLQHPLWFSSSTTSKKPLTDENRESDDDAWIPPNRPLSGDQGNAKLYKQHQELEETEQALEEALMVIDENDSQEDILRKLEEALALEEELEEKQMKQELEEDEARKSQASDIQPVDWLSTRRQALGEDANQHQQADVVPVLQHQLLSEENLVTLLEALGGTDTIVIHDHAESPRMGGAQGMVLCTASSTFHVNNITRSLVDHLKERKLDELGVAGAQISSNAYNRSSASSSKNWNVVDCQNYIVHVFDSATRQALDLEQLWSGKDPLWNLNIGDEEAVDEYVASNPVPADYGPNPEALWDLGKLERSPFAPHRPIIPNLQKQQDRRAGRRRRRQSRQDSSRY